MKCPYCNANEEYVTKTVKKAKGRFVRHCTKCNHSFTPDMLPRKGFCICGMPSDECDGHKNWVQYDKLMGEDVVYQRGTQFEDVIYYGDW